MADPIRIMVFPDRPECILVFAPDDRPLALPELVAPFTKGGVAAACSLAGLDVRVSETVPGRWTQAMTKARRDARAERGQRQRLREAETAAVERNLSPELRERADVIARKHEVDSRLSDKKQQLAKAKSSYAMGGRGLTRDQWRKLEDRIADLKVESQALQTRLGEFKAAEKAENKRLHASQDRNIIRAAKELLDPETFEDILDAAEDYEE